MHIQGDVRILWLEFLDKRNGILNTQGVNMLINVFFGVTVNASRGISSQVESAVLQFVNNFTMAVNPQIIKAMRLAIFKDYIH